MDFCAKCRLTVAPFAPDRTHTPHGVFHSACYSLWMEVNKVVRPAPQGKPPMRRFIFRERRQHSVRH